MIKYGGGNGDCTRDDDNIFSLLALADFRLKLSESYAGGSSLIVKAGGDSEIGNTLWFRKFPAVGFITKQQYITPAKSELIQQNIGIERPLSIIIIVIKLV